MNKRRLKQLLSGVLAVSISSIATAEDQLLIDTHSAQLFSGTYYMEDHTVTFQSSALDASQVYFAVAIDGELVEARYSFESQDIKLWAGNSKLSDQEQDILADAAKALSDYVKSDEEKVSNNLLVLVGALEYWPDMVN